jgi:hypothetical protein
MPHKMLHFFGSYVINKSKRKNLLKFISVDLYTGFDEADKSKNRFSSFYLDKFVLIFNVSIGE